MQMKDWCYEAATCITGSQFGSSSLSSSFFVFFFNSESAASNTHGDAPIWLTQMAWLQPSLCGGLHGNWTSRWKISSLLSIHTDLALHIGQHMVKRTSVCKNTHDRCTFVLIMVSSIKKINVHWLTFKKKEVMKLGS